MGWLNYVCIDESGDLGKFGSKYFTVAAVLVDEPKKLARIIKRLRQIKLKKTIKQMPEIKANKSNQRIREYVLERIKRTDCRIFAIVVEKNKIKDYLFDVKNKLYNYLCGILLNELNLDKGKVIITIDKKHTNTLVREDFNGYIKRKLKRKCKELDIEIFHKPSFASNELQVVDFVAWSINRKFNAGDDHYFRIIEEKIENKENMILWK